MRPRLPGGFSLPPFGLHQWLALVIVSVALWVLGLMWLALDTGAQWTESWGQNVHFHVYLRRQAGEGSLAKLREHLRKLPGVAAVRVVPEEETAAWLRSWLAGVDVNIEEMLQALPRTLEVTPDGGNEEFLFTDLGDEARRLGAEVNPDEFRLVRVGHWLRKLRRLMIFATLIVALALSVVVSNTLRMILLARAEEVVLMRLLGAREWFVRAPFLLEGGLLGAAAGVLAWILLWPVALDLSDWFSQMHVDLSILPMLPLLFLGGGAVGTLGALIATMRDRAGEVPTVFSNP